MVLHMISNSCGGDAVQECYVFSFLSKSIFDIEARKPYRYLLFPGYKHSIIVMPEVGALKAI